MIEFLANRGYDIRTEADCYRLCFHIMLYVAMLISLGALKTVIIFNGVVIVPSWFWNIFQALAVIGILSTVVVQTYSINYREEHG